MGEPIRSGAGRRTKRASDAAQPRRRGEWQEMRLNSGHAFPFGLEARRRDVTQVGKAPPSPEMTLSGLTESGLSGRMMTPIDHHPRLCRTLRPAPQAGCFVSRLYASCESQIALRHRAFGTVAIESSSTSAKW